MDNSKIIKFDPSRLPLRTVKNNKFCNHHYVYILERERMLKCRDCGSIINPFDFVWEWAISGEIIKNNRKWLLKEVKRLREKVDELKREERNTKARLRNAKRTANP